MDSRKAHFIVYVRATDHLDFMSLLTSATELMYKSHQEILLIGDFNVDMLVREHEESEHNSLKDFCDRFCLQNQINEPTRVTENTMTLLNVILSSHRERYTICGNLHLGVSGHDLVYAVRKNKLSRPKAREIEYKSMRHFNKDEFLDDLRNVPWGTAYIYEDVDDLWHHWAKLYIKFWIIMLHPLKKKRVRGDQLP